MADPVPVEAALRRARSVLRADPEAALRALLEAWRAHPAPELAELVEQVSARVEVEPLAGKTLAARDFAFDARAARRDPIDLSVLLPYALARRQSALVPARLARELVKFPRDPRVTRPALAALAMPGWDSAHAHGFWDAVFALLAHHGDPRARAAVVGLDFDAIWSRRMFGGPHAAAIRGMVKRRDRLLARPAPAVTGSHAAAIAELAAEIAPPAPSVDALVEAVLAEPARRELRDVLRDALLAVGDPRGDHMALDALERARPLTPDERKQRQALVQPAWFDALAPFVLMPIVRDGFLAECHISPEREHMLPAVIGDPAWSTVARIGLSAWAQPLPVALFEHPVMRALSALSGMRAETARDVWTPANRWLRTVEILHFGRPWLPLFELAGAVPALRRLETTSIYDRPADFAWLWETPVFVQLAELTVHLGRASLGAWYAVVARASHAHLARVELGRYAFERDPRGLLSHATVTLPGSPREQPHTAKIAEMLATLPAGAVTRVRFVGRALDSRQRDVLAKALPGVTHVDAVAR